MQTDVVCNKAPRRCDMLSKERKGEIALLLLKHRLQEGGVRFTPNLKREVGNVAKAVKIQTAEAMEFAEELIRELMEETFAKTKG